MSHSILVVEDDISIANVLKMELRREGYDVTTAYDGFAGLETARGYPFDLILLDWMLPGVTGIDICQRLRKTDNITPIVFLTSQSQVDDRITGLNAGADDYVIKPFSINEVIARIQCNLRRTKALANQDMLEYDNLCLDRYRRMACREHHEVELTTKEFNLLEYFLLHPGQVLKREEIVEQVWDWDKSSDDSVVEIYVRRLRKKLEAHHQSRLIHTVRGVGYVLR